MQVDEHVTDPMLASVLETTRQACEEAIGFADLVGQSSSSSSSEATKAIARQQKLLIRDLARLRGQHRAAQLSARDTKAATAEARIEVDRLHLQLSNLYYEQRHLEGEITMCESFDHSYQQLSMIPLEEFLALHPGLATTDEAALTIARIEHERKEREKLEQERLELVRQKNKQVAENKKRSDDLANLEKNMEMFIDTALPIQELLEKEV